MGIHERGQIEGTDKTKVKGKKGKRQLRDSQGQN